MAHSQAMRDPCAMGECEWAELYQRYCAECEGAGVEPFTPAGVASLLAGLFATEAEEKCWPAPMLH